jgi:hypothetical protein
MAKRTVEPLKKIFMQTCSKEEKKEKKARPAPPLRTFAPAAPVKKEAFKTVGYIALLEKYF